MENQTEQQEQCFLHQGFILKERVLRLDPQRAEKLLQTQYKLCCTSAERAGDQILLRRHFYVCPCCGAQIPAYIRYFPTKGQKSPPGLSDDPDPAVDSVSPGRQTGFTVESAIDRQEDSRFVRCAVWMAREAMIFSL